MKAVEVLIVFSELHLPYSPSTLNLFYSLKKRNYSVQLIAPQPQAHFTLQKVNAPDIKYIDTPPESKSLIRRIYQKLIHQLSGKNKKGLELLLSAKARIFIREIKNTKARQIVAVDFFSLWCVQQTGRAAHLLSLEIGENDPYYKSSDLNKVLSVIIQSGVRYNYLFNGSVKPPLYIVPNSPEWIDFNPDFTKREKYNLVFCGSAVVEFGIFSVLDFISDFPEYKLTIKGAVPQTTREGIDQFYSHLKRDGRLIINDEYVDSATLTHFISGFWAGFAFYDFYRFPYLRKFNYYTAPSGKLFQYFNSGIPVVGNRLDGFGMIAESKAGILIENLSSLNIKHALDEIERHYEEMASNSKRLSREFDATSAIERFIDSELKV